VRSRIALLGALCACVVVVGGSMADIAAASAQGVVISEFRTRGPNGGSDEFVELYNATGATVPIGGWQIRGSNSAGTTSTRATITAGTTLGAGCHYLVTNSSTSGGPYSGTVAGDQTYATGITDDGGIGLTLSDGTTVVDQAGMSAGSAYKEGTTLTALTTNVDRGYERKPGGTSGSGQDTDDNSADFALVTPNDPQNRFSTCIGGARELSINDVAIQEGNSGTTSFDFTVSLSTAAGPGGVTFDIATGDGSAGAPDDYAAKSLTGQTIPEGSSSYTFSVLANGDQVTEPDEAFFVNVDNVTGATVADGQGQGTILNDDVCGLPYTPAYQIQGSGSSAAITGNVTTQGVVVGDFEGTAGASGFYLQDATGDGNAATSDGIFVFTGSTNAVSVGQVVRVTGFARERFDQTTINGTNSNTSPVTNIVACGTGSVAPTDVTMPFASLSFPERYEGMLVRFPQPLVIAEYFNYDRFGEIVLANPLDGESRPFTGTALDEPGVDANSRTAANALNRITLDDAQSAQNPSVLRHPNGGAFSLANRFRGGDTVQNAVGVLGFDFSLYRIFPTGPADYSATNPRPAAPDPVGGTLRVAAMNTLNFFVTADYPTGDPLDNKCGPSQNVECRGWDSDQPTEFTRQRDKLLQALAGLNADVLGLNELENTTGVEPLESIVSGLPGYAYIDTGTIGTDAIKVGLIYKPAKVTPVGPYKLLTSAVDPRFIDTKSRPVLAQTFEVNATGARFTVAVNHLKSKGSDCNDVGDPDLGDGQGNCSQTRKAAAQALVDWLATDPTGSGDSDFLIVGDLNSYAQEESIDAIKAGADDTAGTSDDYTNLVQQYVGTHAYSFVFDGQSGYLDHALSSTSLTGQVTGLTEWHINADEPDVLDYDTSFKPPAQDALYEPNAFRTSDHDPILVGLGLKTTFDDLCRLTRRTVTSADVADSLCAQLDVAKRAEARGDQKTKDKALKAYGRLLTAQIGKSVTRDQAEFLIGLAAEL
jgi:predicted extracellular nuclease